MAFNLDQVADFQFHFDARELWPNTFPDLTLPDSSSADTVESEYEAAASTSLFMPQMQSSEPIWTPITLQTPPSVTPQWIPHSSPMPAFAQSQLEPSIWVPCSPPSSPMRSLMIHPIALAKQFEYPDPQITSALPPAPYKSLPPRSVPVARIASPAISTEGQIASFPAMSSAPISGLKRKRSIQLENLYTSDQESCSYGSDTSNLSTAPCSPSTPDFRPVSSSIVKKGPKHRLEQTKERQAVNERRRAYYHRAKRDPIRKQAMEERQQAYLERCKQNPTWRAKDAARKRQPAQPEPQIEKPLECISKKATPVKAKPRWKGWVELSSDSEEESLSRDDDVSVPTSKKRSLEKEIQNAKDFSKARSQGGTHECDIDLDEDSDADYSIIRMSQSRRGARGGDAWARRSGRFKKPVSYAEGKS